MIGFSHAFSKHGSKKILKGDIWISWATNGTNISLSHYHQYLMNPITHQFEQQHQHHVQ